MILDYSQNGIAAVFEITADNSVILRRFAAETAADIPHRKKNRQTRWMAIADVQVTGENVNDHHGAKHTGTSGAFSLRYVTHRCAENEKGSKLEFDLADDRMRVTVHYQFYTGIPVVRAWTVVTNTAAEPLGLEYVSSFAYTGFDEGELNPNEKMTVWIPIRPARAWRFGDSMRRKRRGLSPLHAAVCASCIHRTRTVRLSRQMAASA